LIQLFIKGLFLFDIFRIGGLLELELLLFKWVLAFALAPEEAFKSRHLWEHLLQLLYLFLGKSFILCQVLPCLSAFFGLLFFSELHLVDIVSVDIFIFSLALFAFILSSELIKTLWRTPFPRSHIVLRLQLAKLLFLSK
jgi:hypothetical protein